MASAINSVYADDIAFPCCHLGAESAVSDSRTCHRLKGELYLSIHADLLFQYVFAAIK